MKLSIMKRVRLSLKRRVASLFTGEGKSFPPRIIEKRPQSRVTVPTMHVMQDLGQLPCGWYEEF